MRRNRRWWVPIVAIASIGVMSVGKVDGATPKAAPRDGIGLPPGGAHFFDTDTAGLVVNRRPSNVSFLASGKDAYRVEDSQEATAGYDDGFLAQPEKDTMQATRRIVQ